MDDLREPAERLEAMSARAETVAGEWSEREFTGSADNGGVVATVDPVGTLKALDISRLSKRGNDGVTSATRWSRPSTRPRRRRRRPRTR